MLHTVVVMAAAVVAVPGSSAMSSDTEAVRAVLVAENRMYDVYDASWATRFYAPEIRWQNPFGVRLMGEPAVQHFLVRLFSRPGFRSAQQVTAPTITDINILSSTTASAWSEEASQGQIRSDGSTVRLRKSHILYVLVKRDGRWLITDEQIMDERD